MGLELKCSGKLMVQWAQALWQEERQTDIMAATIARALGGDARR
jgi:hypothetical protein